MNERMDKHLNERSDGGRITNELREWDSRNVYLKPKFDELTAIADRIDTEHERLMQEQPFTVDMVPMTDERMAEHGWVRLPKDADGEYIHIGGVMDSKVDYLFDGKPFTVRGLVLCEDGWEVTDGRFGNRYKPDSLRHHHEPTVEDVLREFADAMSENLGMYTGEVIDADEWRDADRKTIAEYAKHLRLAGDSE